MKRIIIAIMVAMIYLTSAFAQGNDTIRKDTLMATESGISYVDTKDSSQSGKTEVTTKADNDDDYSFGMFDSKSVVAITAVILIFGLPFFVVFISLYFRYKNRKAKYMLVQQAIATGQPIPEGLFKQENQDGKSKGIQLTCIGIGLFIFLWALTDFDIACVGLFIAFIGLGKLISAIIEEKKRNDTQSNTKQE